jgi:hypothetical protein
MSTVNKTSLRDEFDRIKTEFDQLMNKKKAPAEYIAIFQAMLTLMELLMSIFLEKETKKNSKNSSKPPSQTDKDESSITNPGSKSKGKKESKTTASNMRVKEHVTVSQVQFCNVCGKDLSDVPCQHHERRTKVDIVFEKVVEHTDAEVKECPDCDSVVIATFPEDMPGPMQYGKGVKSYIINLLVCQMISLNRAQKLLRAMIGTIISEATMLKFILRLYLALEDWETSAKNHLLYAKAINVDETSLRVDKKNHWIHVYSSGDITLKFLHRKRGLEAIEDIDIIPRYNGTIIHDCWASYLAYCHCDHGLCGSHLTRELVHIIESNHSAWARNMKRLLLETCRNVSKSKRKKLTKKAYSNLQKRYRNIITRGEKEMPIIPPKPNGKKGKMAKSDAHNLLERLKEYESAVLLFARDPYVSFTNNRAERDLRMAKVKQKISGCFRTELYAKAYCRISSYLQPKSCKSNFPCS